MGYPAASGDSSAIMSPSAAMSSEAISASTFGKTVNESSAKEPMANTV